MELPKVICLESEALQELVRAVVSEVRRENSAWPWVTAEEAKRLLGISADSTLQKFRDEGAIRFSRVAGRNLLYHRPSLLAYIEKQARDTF